MIETAATLEVAGDNYRMAITAFTEETKENLTEIHNAGVAPRKGKRIGYVGNGWL
jgi:hypothetical protein